jgi:transcription elongation factor GreA
MVAADHIDVKPVDAELPCPSMAEPHLSPQAHARLVAELEERTTSRRRELSLAIERAREHGDIKENADYDAAKNEQGINEARVRQLEQMLANAVVIDSSTSGDVVEAGTVVDLRYKGDDDVLTYLVGSIEERNEKYDVLSTNSPIGMAILGKAPGDTVTYQGPKREMSVTVVAVRLPE